MARTSYPNDADLLALATSVNLNLPAGFAFAGLAAAAIAEWERRTGYSPFLGSGLVETRAYDPPGPNRRSSSLPTLLGGGRVLDLEAGLYGVSNVSIGVGPSAAGTVLIAGTDFWLEPLNAPATPGPWQRIRFRTPVFGQEASVHVSGNFGYGASLPEDAWQSIARLGCAIGLESLVEGLRTVATAWAEADVRETYDPQLIASLGANFRSAAERAIYEYRRLSF